MALKSDRIHAVPEDGQEFCTVIVEAVAEVTGKPESEIGSLFDTIEADGIELIFNRESVPDRATLTFPFEDCKVTIRGTGEVIVEKV
jgi:hypothetical protein